MSKILLAGCSMAALMVFSAEGSGGGTGSGQDRSGDIRAALQKLDPKNDDDWTQGGLPDMARMKELTAWDDLSRQEVALASPDYRRDKPELADAKKADQSAPEMTDEEKAAQNTKPNTPPNENPLVGQTQLDPYEGQAHTADQTENRQAAAYSKQLPEAVEIAEHINDPILLLEAAVAAANADPARYLRNGALMGIIRHYQIDQVAIKSHQERLDQRQERRDENAADAEKKANG